MAENQSNVVAGEGAGKGAGLRRAGVAREELRQRILQSVERLHSVGGYEAVTMRAVAKDVGVSAMSLYRYFPNKGALLKEVWSGVLDEALNAARVDNRLDSSPVGRLRRLYASYIAFWLAHPQDFRLLFDPTSELPPDLVETGPALRFRREAESLIAACLGASASTDQLEQAYDLCRIKVVGFLYACICLEAKPHRSSDDLLAVLLDDIERQLHRI